MQMPEETSSQIKNRRAAKALAETAKLPPQTAVEVRRGVRVRRTKNEIPVLRLHYSCHPERNPEINPDWKKGERKKYTSQADWDREQEIFDEAGGGELVFRETLDAHWDKIVITTRSGSRIRTGSSKPDSIMAAPAPPPCCAATPITKERFISAGNTTSPAWKSGSTPPTFARCPTCESCKPVTPILPFSR
jgi:hypothetical protein